MTPPQIPDYTFRTLIGEGSTGRVYSAEYGGQTVMAVKTFEPDTINRQLISDALVKIFNAGAHDGIVEVHDFDLASEQAYMATSLHGEHYQTTEGEEAVRPRTIEGLMGHLHDDDAWLYVRQISDALSFLHKLRVVHGNIEPGNVLLDGSTPPHVKLTDFSQGLVGAVPKVIPGHSVFYAAPEQIRQPEHYFGGRGERWDVYAFGALVYHLLTGEYPRLRRAIEEIKKREEATLDVHFNYDFRVLADMLEKEETVDWPAPAADEVESARRAIIDRCLKTAPEERFADMREVARAFEDLDLERDRREEHRKIAEAQVETDKKIGGMKKIAAIFGGVAILGLIAAAFFGQRWSSVRNNPPENSGTATQGETGGPREPIAPVVDTAKLDALTAELESSRDDLGESQSALEELFLRVTERNEDGTSLYNLPEDTVSTLLNYYEDFASKHKDNPDLALDIVHAEGNAGVLNLIQHNGPGALEHFESAGAKMKVLLADAPVDDNGGYVHAYASILTQMSESQAMVGLDKAAAESAFEAQRLWENLSQRNVSSDFATREHVKSLLVLGERLMAVDRAAEMGMQAQRAKKILKTLEEKNLIGPPETIALAKADHLLGLAERSNGNLSDAKDLQIAATQRLLELKIADVDSSDTLDSQLAAYYGETADTLVEDGNRQPAVLANEEAIRILVELVAQHQSNTSYHLQLAQRLGTRAAIQRDEGNAKEARAAQVESANILRDLYKAHPERHDITLQFAYHLQDLMELYGDAKLRQEVVDTGHEAKNVMNALLQADLDAEANNAKRDIYRAAYAEVLLDYAEYLDSYKVESKVVIDLYTKASRQLKSLIASGSASEEVTKELAASNARIVALGGTPPE